MQDASQNTAQNAAPAATKIFGRHQGSLDLGWVELHEVSYDQSSALADHSHAESCLTLARRGSFRNRSPSGEAECRKGELIFDRGQWSHANAFGSAGLLSWVLVLRCDERDELPSGRRLPLPSSSGLQRSQLVSATIAALETAWRQLDSAAVLEVESLLFELLASFDQRPVRQRGEPAWLAIVDQALCDDLARTYTLIELGDMAGVHPAHLSRTYRRHRGRTPGQFLREIRLVRARTQLEREPECAPLSQLAGDLGFFDQAHFSRLFKARFGTPPGRWRRNATHG